MTARLPFTQQTVRRAISAARKEGLHVLAIKSDGTVLLGDKPPAAPVMIPTAAHNAPPSEWEDVEA